MARGDGESLQSIWLPVPAVEPVVDPFRRDGDWSRDLGVPAHITLGGPWPLSTPMRRGSLADLAASARGTSFQIGSAGVLAGAICLFLADERALRQLRERLLAIVGEPDPFRSGWRPHLTVSREGSSTSLATVEATVSDALPIECLAGNLCLSRLTDGRLSVETL